MITILHTLLYLGYAGLGIVFLLLFALTIITLRNPE